jgi:hypothetical protein
MAKQDNPTPPSRLKPHQAAVLTSLLTQIVHNPRAIQAVLDDLDETLKRAGLEDNDIEDIKGYLTNLGEIVQEKGGVEFIFW